MAHPAEDDPLQTLSERLRATQDAVERLAAEATGASGAAAGAQDASEGFSAAAPSAGAQADAELHALLGLVDVLRGLLPAELQARVTDLVRQVLLLVRAILDWWIERLHAPPPGAPAPARIEDIEVT